MSYGLYKTQSKKIKVLLLQNQYLGAHGTSNKETLILRAKEIGLELEIIEEFEGNFSDPLIENLDSILVKNINLNDCHFQNYEYPIFFNKIIQYAKKGVTIVSILECRQPEGVFDLFRIHPQANLRYLFRQFYHDPSHHSLCFLFHQCHCKSSNNFFDFNQKRGEIYYHDLEYANEGRQCNREKYVNCNESRKLMVPVVDHPLIEGCECTYERLFCLDSHNKLLLQWISAQWGNFTIDMCHPGLYIMLIGENLSLNSFQDYCRVLLNSIRLKKQTI